MISIIEELDKLCIQSLLPELATDIGTDLIDTKHFDNYRIQLNHNLHRIFDILSDRSLAKRLPLGITLLFCEQTARHIEFRTDQPILIQSLEALRPRIAELSNDESFRNETLKWYKNRITTTTWKRNLGASHGLATLCEIWYKNDQAWRISTDDGMFLLSAGTLMLEHFEHVYKELGMIIFLAVLRKMSETDLETTNLFEPIFDICKHNISNIKDLEINRLLWTCLIECLRLKPACQLKIPSKWNHRDDIASALLTRLAFESNSQMRLMLMRCIVDVFAPTLHFKLFAATDEDVYRIDLGQVRTFAKNNQCLAAFRWTKKLVKIWAYYVSCLFGPASDVAFNLRIVHLSYLVCLFGTPLSLVAAEMRDFLNEIPTHLLQLIQHNDHDREIVNEVDQMLVSFVEHLDMAEDMKLSEENRIFYRQRSKTISEIRKALSN